MKGLILILKLLIVDDEPDICELIHQLIDWHALGLISIGSTQNGIDALEIILRQKPDIVITDIQMPGMNGLELVERSLEESPKTRFIFVSGYQEFEYARTAIHLGVEEYLVKPINEKNLNLVLGRIVEEINASENIDAGGLCSNWIASMSFSGKMSFGRSF